MSNSLAQLTDAYDQPETIDGLPVESVPVGVDGVRRVRINTSKPEPDPALSDFNISVGTKLDDILNKLTGANGQQRYQLWPEKVVREGLSAAGDVMHEGTVNPGLRREDITDIPKPDMPTKDSTWLGKLLKLAPVAAQPGDTLIEKAQAISALAGTGGLAGGAEGASLNAAPSLRPALRYKDKLYKGKPDQQHMDIIPKELYPEFERMAMSGEDISHYNFGFVNDKGHFLDREKALEYGINNGLIDPHAGKYGALTSTMELNSAKNFIPAIKDNSTGKIYSGDKNSNHPTLKYQDNKFLKDTTDGFADNSGNFLTRKEFDNKYGINESSQLTTQLLADSSKPGVAIEAVAKTASPFFSALEHNVSQISQSKMTGDQWLGTLSNKPGVKPEELQWTGLGEFLKENAGKPVSKAQIEEHLTNNKVELKEVSKGGGEVETLARKLAEEENGKGSWNRIGGGGQEHYWRDAEKQLKQNRPSNTKYHSYQLPGGENYREMLLTLSNQTKNAARAINEKMINKYGGLAEAFKKWTPEEAAYYDQVHGTHSSNPAMERLEYRSSHWDEPNILAHVRMNDRTIDGKKSLHLEEIQSDWHQQGRDKGYKQDIEGPIKKRYEDAKALGDVKAMQAANNELRNLLETDAIRKNASGVPDAPFKKSWHELTLKRMIREAAEKSYDRLSWTPGEAQAARYDLSKQVDNIKYSNDTLIAFDKHGKEVLHEKRVPLDKISDYIGKEAAKKLMDKGISSTGERSLANADLKIGGEGMKGFYDQIIPKSVNKIAKEHGAKVETGKTKEGHTIHYIDLPEGLKNTALQKGFPLFSKGGHMLIPIEGDPFEKEK